jgi:5-methylcytosine-specific restriction endonuclease McrA
MKSHIKTYLNYFDLGEQDVCRCEGCMRESRIDAGNTDIHHIWGRLGKDANKINNLMLLCRRCHEKAHSTLSKGELQLIHNNVMQGNRKIYLK